MTMGKLSDLWPELFFTLKKKHVSVKKKLCNTTDMLTGRYHPCPKLQGGMFGYHVQDSKR